MKTLLPLMTVLVLQGSMAYADAELQRALDDAEKVSTGTYERLELKTGDVITGVNGRPVSDPADAIGKLDAGGTVQVERDGQTETIRYNQSAPMAAPGDGSEEGR